MTTTNSVTMDMIYQAYNSIMEHSYQQAEAEMRAEFDKRLLEQLTQRVNSWAKEWKTEHVVCENDNE